MLSEFRPHDKSLQKLNVRAELQVDFFEQVQDHVARDGRAVGVERVPDLFADLRMLPVEHVHLQPGHLFGHLVNLRGQSCADEFRYVGKRYRDRNRELLISFGNGGRANAIVCVNLPFVLNESLDFRKERSLRPYRREKSPA